MELAGNWRLTTRATVSDSSLQPNSRLHKFQGVRCVERSLVGPVRAILGPLLLAGKHGHRGGHTTRTLHDRLADRSWRYARSIPRPRYAAGSYPRREDAC